MIFFCRGILLIPSGQYEYENNLKAKIDHGYCGYDYKYIWLEKYFYVIFNIVYCLYHLSEIPSPFQDVVWLKHTLTNDTSPCQCPDREHEGSVSYWGVDSLGSLHLQLCFSWSAFLLSPAQRFVPHLTSSLCTEELLLRPKLKWWLMKLCDNFRASLSHLMSQGVACKYRVRDAPAGSFALMLVLCRVGWKPGGSRSCLRNSGQLCS